MQTTSHLLSLSIWVPIFAGLLVLATGADRNAATARAIALVGALFGFLVTVPLYTGFNTQSAAMQFVELTPWISQSRSRKLRFHPVVRHPLR